MDDLSTLEDSAFIASRLKRSGMLWTVLALLPTRPPVRRLLEIPLKGSLTLYVTSRTRYLLAGALLRRGQ